MSTHQFIIKTTDASTDNAGDVLVTIYGPPDVHVIACQRDPLNHSRWQPPLPVHALDGCEACGHRATDHEGGCTLCSCRKLGGVR